ncbi:MAG: hypothetical protein OQK46_01445 [Gammaproteobacteria bacterium]|nr:hypothetical protein [Gammaproteobacteria bacterium]
MIKSRLLLSGLLLSFCASSLAVELDAKLDWSGYQKYGFAVNGVIEKVTSDIGQEVKKGGVLANLIATPFKYRTQKCQATVKKFEPLVFDARLEFEQAEELFERTVLSEVELQKIDGRYKNLLEQQNEAKADCLLEQWDMKLSVLKASESIYIINTNMVSGMVISDENKSAVYIESVSSQKASAVAALSYAQKKQFSIGQELIVLIDQQEISAKVKSIDMSPNKENKYQVRAEFNYTNMVEPGKLIKLKY